LRLPAAVVAAAATLLAAAPASARLHACGEVQCETLTVPLDPTGAIPGTTRLFVERVRARRRLHAPLVLVTGGPGQAGSSLIADALPGGAFSADVLHRDVIAFDPRGTGRSGLLRCPPLERARSFLATDAAAECWSSLGDRRVAYTSRAVADDIDTIRQGLHVPQVALYGISYGTSIAQTYARVYPQRVDRMILDSTLEPGGGDMLYRPTFVATGRVLRALCAGSRCRGVTRDPVADFAAVVRSPPAGVTRFDLLDILLDGDFDPDLRGAFPAAIHSAVGGHPGAVKRLLRAARRSDASDFDDPRNLSIADYAATVCEEGAFPWTRTTDPAQRSVQAAAAVAAIPPAGLYPWDQASALSSDFLATCLKWPVTPAAPDLGSAYPDVPVLVLSGRGDLRTPLEQAIAVAAQYPRATLRSFANAGHDVIDGAAGECGALDAREFLAARTVGHCRGRAAPPRIRGRISRRVRRRA
jgi:pimeloyl-ACP methyl ester carboxylesterase